MGSWSQIATTVLLSVASALLSLAVAWGGVKAHLENKSLHGAGVEKKFEAQDAKLDKIQAILLDLVEKVGELRGQASVANPETRR